MKVAPIVIDRFAKWIVGGVPFESAKRIVAGVENAELTGEQKRQHAVNEMVTLSYSLAGFLLNLAVELAVAWLKSKSESR